jgi:poly(3-hydroxybutyrate) depolymerase
MMYNAYQAQADATEALRLLALAAARNLDRPSIFGRLWPRNVWAGWEVLARAGLTHKRPAFGIETAPVGNRQVEVREVPVRRTPFCTLLRFEKEMPQPQPRVLLVAPMSGHFATLLRDTVRTLLPEHDVYLTDWHNARDVPLHHGQFGFDDFVDHLIGFLETMGPGAHVLAICQPCVATLVAVSIMAQDGHAAQPRSMTLMAGPIDTRISPTKVNEFATRYSLAWFENNVIGLVPSRYPGAFRRVYPGFLQLAAFMSMNVERHMKAFRDLYNGRVKGDHAAVDTIRKFYDEYFAVMDLTAEFYLETVRDVFQEHRLPRGQMTWRGRRVEPRAVRKTALLTVEGERDDICSIGQTLAAQDLCSGLRPYMKHHHMQTRVGHYGVFSGRRWSGQIYPLVRDLIQVSQ